MNNNIPTATMKLLKLLLQAVILTVTITAYGQDDSKKDSIYIQDYEKLKQLHLKELNSDIHIEQSELFRKFLKRTNAKGELPITNPDDILNWIEDNIEKTDFLSFNEAKFEWGILERVMFESRRENKEYHMFMLTAVRKHGASILIEVTDDLMDEYPEKFGLPKDYKSIKGD